MSDMARLKAHAVHMISAYAKWAEDDPHTNSPFRGLDNEEALRRSGLFAVWTPDELVASEPARPAGA